MAVIRKSKGNILFEGASGRIGNVVLKQYKDKVVITAYSKPDKRKTSAAQKARRMLFEEAVSYAKKVYANPKRKAAFARRSKGKRNAFQAAVSAYMKTDGNIRLVKKLI